jgi:hypothetical protein
MLSKSAERDGARGYVADQEARERRVRGTESVPKVSLNLLNEEIWTKGYCIMRTTVKTRQYNDRV